MNYGYLDLQTNPEKIFGFWKSRKITVQEVYTTVNNTLFSFLIPIEPKKGKRNSSQIKLLSTLLKQHGIKSVLISPELRKIAPEIEEIDFEPITGTGIYKHLLLQAFFLYIKTAAIDIQDIGIHICAKSLSDIYFIFENINKFNTVYSMCTENEKYSDNILEKYGIAVHFTDAVSNKLILFLDGDMPETQNCHVLDLSKCEFTLESGNLTKIFPCFSAAEAELLIKLDFDNIDDGFPSSGVKIKSVIPNNYL